MYEFLCSSNEVFQSVVRACIAYYVNATDQHPESVWLMMFGEGVRLEELAGSAENRIEAAQCVTALLDSLN